MTNKKTPFSFQVRLIHRYLGYFLAGIMAVYAISGIIMIFRQTNFLKSEVVEEIHIGSNLSEGEIGPKIKMGVKVDKKEGDVLYFKDGNYNEATGMATVKKMKLPFLLDKMEKMHKATTKSPLFYLNIFFGTSLLFFVISAFWMYTPKMPVFKKGMYFALAGFLLTLIMVFV
ncbi:hypothetical protein U1E44_14185 [Arenibacter sp. GZD96]|uniref:hypothetical protein n=1 Tax=Aurantibrevibacter litoralis TaxID=3106030 RepID=UPI002AFF9F73|nr:hypothetical protein [Arenibacter sp. GZD-96]MEA1787247.1 hypothetical protein [Arenibacter sp. GZD-96]